MRSVISTIAFSFCLSLISPPDSVAQSELDAVTASVRELCILPDRQGNHWEVEAGADGATIFKIVDLGLSIEFSAAEWEGIQDKIEDRPDARQCVRELTPIFLEHLRSNRSEDRNVLPLFRLGEKIADGYVNTACVPDSDFDSDLFRTFLTNYNSGVRVVAQELSLPPHRDIVYNSHYSDDFRELYLHYLNHIHSHQKQTAFSIGYFTHQVIVFSIRSFTRERQIQQKTRAREEGFPESMLANSPSIEDMRRIQSCELANFDRAKFNLHGRLRSAGIEMEGGIDIDARLALRFQDNPMVLDEALIIFYGQIEGLVFGLQSG